MEEASPDHAAGAGVGVLVMEEPRHVVAFEYRSRMRAGKSRPLLVVGMDDDEQRYRLVLKLRRPESPQGHRGPTSLACELICAALARRLGLPVPDYAVVRVTAELAGAVQDD